MTRHRIRTAALLTIAAIMLFTAALPSSAEQCAESTGAEPGQALQLDDIYGFRCSEIRKDRTGVWEYGILSDGTAVITGFHIESDTLAIPDEVDGYRVTILARAPLEKIDYSRIRRIKKVTLPKGLKAIEHLAFEYFDSLRQIKLPAGLTSIGYGAFRNCQHLQKINIPEQVRRIGEAAFSGCAKLAAPAWPAGLEVIGRQAFYNCRNLRTLAFPSSLREIGDQAFAYSGVTKIKLNEGLTLIGEKAFFGNNAKEIVLPSSVRTVGHGAFHQNGSNSLKDVTAGNPQTEFGRGVFGYDDGWTAYYKANRKELDAGKEADFDKENPENWFDYYADAEDFGQNTVTFTCYPGSTADRIYQYRAEKKYLQGNAENVITAPADRVLRAGMYRNNDLVYELVIPEGVEEIEDAAFAGLSTLNKVTFPSTLKKIGARAFEECIGLKEVSLPAEGMTEIGEAAFKGCAELTRINIPDGITEIADSAFEECRKLSSVALPKNGLVRIGDSAFAGCAALTGLKIGSGLEAIGEKAFAYSGLKDMKIPDTVTSLGKRAFYKSGLKSLQLPGSLEEIPESLCEFSTELNSLTISKGTRRIGRRAFAQCYLRTLTLPEGLESIGEEAFAFNTEGVLSFHKTYLGKKAMTNLKTIRFPASLTAIGKKAFAGCDCLTTVSFAKNAQLKEIGDYAFTVCLRLKAVALPESLQALGEGAFSDCRSMTGLSAPDSVTEIGADLLKNHSGKLKVTCAEGSAMHQYLRDHYPNVMIIQPKK